MIVNFLQDPKVLIGIVATLVSALVALTVVLLTQRATDKRSKREFLTQKLEELYLELSSSPDDVMQQWNHMWDILEGKVKAMESPLMTDDLYGHDRAKKIAMYIRLYFPELQNLHTEQFSIQSQFSTAVHAVLSGEEVEMQDVKQIMFANGDAHQNIEKAIIEHKEKLVNGAVIKALKTNKKRQPDVNFPR